MTTVMSAPPRQVENAWHNAQRQFDEAAALLGLDPAMRAVLREVKRQLIVSFPVERTAMEDSCVREGATVSMRRTSTVAPCPQRLVVRRRGLKVAGSARRVGD